MKKLLWLVIVVALFIENKSANAQQFKIGIIDRGYILKNLPDFQALTKEVEATSQGYQKIIKEKYDNYQAKAEIFEKLKTSGTSEVILRDKMSELENLQKSLQDFQVNSENDIRTLYARKFRPIDEKVKKAISDYSKQNNYLLVLRSDMNIEDGETRSMVLYASSAEDDVSDNVLKVLGVTTPVVPKGKIGLLNNIK
ncbi:OmpH family outer membrane protein [Runella limosa]|uniref:OmpH family outer membrane protein n=1 Tax=Runella limosa TaxID=370978 RepID=UPI000400710C|nr:OmpH family outer membrane protein [Runella limosa]